MAPVESNSLVGADPLNLALHTSNNPCSCVSGAASKFPGFGRDQALGGSDFSSSIGGHSTMYVRDLLSPIGGKYWIAAISPKVILALVVLITTFGSI